MKTEDMMKFYQYPPLEKETEFQRIYRMGRNSLILELIDKIDQVSYNQDRKTFKKHNKKILHRYKCRELWKDIKFWFI